MSKTPKLRFNQFNEDLKKYKFKDLVLLQRGSSPRPISKYTTTSDDGVNWIKIGDVSKDSTFINKTNEKITKEGAQKSRFVGVGDLILSNSMSFGRPYIMNIEGYIHDGWFVIRNYEKNFNRDYLCQLLTSDAIQNQYRRLAAGGVVDNISSELVNSVNVNLPSIKEQEKISSLFSLIDNKISLQSEKLEKLKDYKKGMMQKIFSRELRFKDDEGRDYPEWEEKKLGEVFNIKAGGDIKSENVTKEMTEKNIYPVYANALTNKGLYGYTDDFKVEGNTITVTGRGDIGYAIARTEKYYPIVRLLVLSPVVKLDTIYFENIINHTKIFVESTGVPQLTSPQLSSVKVKFPIYEEQVKISKVFKIIDKKIEKEKEKLDSLNEYKKGLLQQMFV